MNAQFAKSFLLCFAKDILQRKSVLLDIFRADFDNHFLSQKNICDILSCFDVRTPLSVQHKMRSRTEPAIFQNLNT